MAGNKSETETSDRITQSRLIQAGVYCRVSTEDQAEKGASLEAQKDFLLRWAAQENIEVQEDNIFLEDGYSGKDLNRPALTKLRKSAKDKKFSVLLIYHNDRLSRDTRDTLAIVEELSDAGVMTRFSNFDADTASPEGKLLFTMLSGFAQYFREDLGRKTSLGMQKRKEDGTHIGRLGEYFERIDPNLSLVPDNVKVKDKYRDMVETIYYAYDQGDSLRGIARRYGLSEASGYKKVASVVKMVEWLKRGRNRLKFE